MSFYNPMQDQDSYYDPTQNTSPDSPGQIVGSAIKSLLVVGTLNAIGGVATKFLGAQAKSTLKSWAKNESSIYRKAFAQKTISAAKSMTSSFEPVRKAMRDSSIGKAAVARRITLQKMEGQPGYGLARLTTAFKNPKTLLATTVGTWKKNVLSGMAVAYGVDSLLGITRDIGLKDKKWYDLPGQAQNFGKWLVNDTIYGTAMGAAAPVAKAIGSAGNSALRKTFSGSFGKKVMDAAAKFAPGIPTDKRYDDFFDKKVLANIRSNQEQKFLTGSVKKGLFGIVSTVSESYRQIENSLYSARDTYKTPGMTFGDKTKKALGVVNSALKTVREIHLKPRTKLVTAKSSEGLEALSWISGLAKDAVKNPLKAPIDLITADMEKHILPAILKHNRSKSGLGKVFGFLDPARVKDVVNQDKITEIAGHLKQRYVASHVDQIMGQIQDMKIGSNIYKDWRGSGIKGAGVDLGAFDPIQMMRRTASAIVNKQWQIPLTKMSASLGDLTGLSSHLAEAPNIAFFDKAPNFRIDGSDKFTNTSDIDFAQRDAKVLYVNGKYAAFNDASVNVIDSKRTLIFAHKSSKSKKVELQRINTDRLRKHAATIDPKDAAAEFNRLVDRADYQPRTNNRYLNFLDRRGFGLPTGLEDLSYAIKNKLTGKKDYKLKAGSYFDDSTSPDLQFKNLPYIDNIYEHTSQVFSNILHHRGAHQLIAKMSLDARLKKDILEVLTDDQTLIRKTADALNAEGTRGIITSKDNVRALNFVKAFPKEAESHNTVKRLGSLSAMTAIHTLRKNYIEDIFNKNFLNEIDSTGSPHPLIEIAQELFNNGVINKNEHNALNLHSKLSVFKDPTLRKDMDTKQGIQSVMTTMRRNFGTKLMGIHTELIDFISNYEMRSPKIRNSQEEIVPGFNLIGDDNPFFSIGAGPLGRLKSLAENSMSSVTDQLAEILPVKKRYFKNQGFWGGAKYIGGVIGLSAAVFGAYRVTDTLVAANPMFDNTMFENGISGASADVVAKTRLGVARIADLTGITNTMKYMHGLAPTSETSVPGGIIGGIAGFAMSRSPWGAFKGFVGGALLNRAASPYLPDMTKSYKELREIYSGREQVPIMKNPTWLLGLTPWEGSKVEGWSPNWYVQTKSRWQESSTLYGSAFQRLIHEPLPLLGFNIGDITDPYYMERKHFFTRPYPVSGGVFDEVPIVGKILSSTIGRIIKPAVTMHQEFLARDPLLSDNQSQPLVVRPPKIGESKMLMATGGGPRSMGGITNNQGFTSFEPNKVWSERASEDFLYDISNFAGLKGFIGGTIAEKIFGDNVVTPTLETAGRMASFSRSYTDLNLGGMGTLTEPIRRLVEKAEYKQYGQNPIPNMMPNWLPEQFLYGDPYVKLLRGELRLPGEAYLKTHPNVKRTMSARASMIGGNKDNIVQYFTGLLPPLLADEYDILETGTASHRAVQEQLAAEGLLIQAEAFVSDIKNDITGHVDAIIRDGLGGKGRRALEIKTINEKAFANMTGPKYEHVGQLNFYLKQLGMQKGTFLYINRENPSEVKTFQIQFSQNRWEKDIQKLKEARGIAATMMQEGIGDTLGYSYSWMDRLEILADVAPTSLEYKEAKAVVQKQIKAGVITTDEGTRFKDILQKRQARIRKYELYPNRFKGKVFNPDTETQIESLNEDIKAAAEYSTPERVIGSLWERFTNTNTFLVNKFFAAKDPLEHYKMTRLYGKEFKPWDEPIRSWAEPMARGMASKSNPITGAISFGATAQVIGGPIGAVGGALIGGAYGTIHGLYRFATNSAYIPGNIEEKREITSFFDAAKYARNDMMASLSTGLTQQEYISAKQATLTAFNNSEGSTVANLFRATPFSEKPYIEGFLQENDPRQRAEILKYVPDDLAKALKRQWGTNDNKDGTQKYNEANSDELSTYKKRVFNRTIMDPRVNLEDVQLKVIQNEGMDAHEFGLGWNEQMLRVQESQNQIQEQTINDLQYRGEQLGPNLNSAHVRGLINSLFNKEGIRASSQVYISNIGNDFNSLNITVRRDRSRTIINALNNRERYNLNE